MTLLISAVNTDDDILLPAAESLVVEVTDQLREKISVLRRAVEGADALSIDSFHTDGYWSSINAELHEDACENGAHDSSITGWAKGSRAEVELQIVTVRRSGFCFKAVPKGSDAKQCMYSDLFSFDVLGL